ncbi:MAG: PLP-dependent transferase [Nitratireductor sp.]
MQRFAFPPAWRRCRRSSAISRDHLVISDVSYAGVAELARDTLPRFGIEVTAVDMTDLDALKRQSAPIRLIHVETPVNPLLRLTDSLKPFAGSRGLRRACFLRFNRHSARHPASAIRR